MKPLFNKLGAKAEKQDKGHDPEREAAKAIEDARRQAASRHGGPPGQSAAPSGLPSRPPPQPEPPTFVEREPRQPAAPPPGSKFAERPPPQAPPLSPPGGPMGGFAAPSGGPSATPDEERRAITDMALEDLRARRAPAPDDTPPRIPAEELERRRPPAPGESLPGVPPPHIPSEDLRDQALQEILDRKERLDREYRERHGHERGETAKPARPKGKLHGLAKKRLAAAPPSAGAASAPAAPPAPAPPATAASRPAPAKRALKKSLRAKAPTPPAAQPQPEPVPESPPEEPPVVETPAETTGGAAEEALAAIKGVGPVIRGALLERFQSVEAIRAADPGELTEVDGIGPALAKRIKTAL